MQQKNLLALLLTACLAAFGFLAGAQQREVTGSVTDARDGTGLVGVTVMAKGTSTGTATDAHGHFRLALPAGPATLVVSYVGYASQEVPVTSDQLSVALKPSNAALNEVVVIGYGTQQKKDLTGSISTVSAKDFNPGAVSTPEQLIAGKVAGVVVTSNSGAPGAGSTIRIRGGSSLNGSNDPLIVIDGVPVSNSGISGASNPLALINPDDIETFTILKDASATAIYGNRASNGVILITTKRGAAGGKLKVSFSSLNSVSIKANEVPVLSAGQVRQIVHEKGTASQIALLGMDKDSTISTNWQDQIYDPAFGTDNNIALTGGIRKLPYRLSVEYLNQHGILKTSSLQRASAGLSLSPVLLHGDLQVQVNLKGSYNKNRFANTGAIGAAVSMDPTKPVYDKNSPYGGYFEWEDNTGAPIQLATRNPVAELEMYHNTSEVYRTIDNIALDYRLPFFRDLHAHVNAGYDASKGDGGTFVPAEAALNYNQGGSSTHYSQVNRNKLFDFYLNYAKDLSAISSKLDVTAGYEYQDFFRGAPSYPNMNAAKTDTLSLPLADSTRYTLVSFYGRLNYNLLDRYMLTATLRRDGSSRFSPANHWGLFPSVAFAWRISQESFLRNSSTVSDLKLRLGYGTTGNEDIGTSDYPYLPLYTLSTNVAQYPMGDGSVYTYRAEAYDPNIKWEHTTTYNAGVDYGFLNQRIYGALDVYYKKTFDLLVDIPTAAGANLSNHVLTNVGDVENRGLEFSVNALAVSTPDFKWNVGFNITYNKNEITKLSKLANDTTAGILNGNISGGTGNSIQIWSVGYPTSTFYVYKQVYDADGKPIEGVYADVNHDPSNLFYRYQTGQPKVTLGFNTRLSYRRWDLSTSLRANLGNYMYNNINAGATLNSILNSIGFIGNTPANYLKTGFTNSQYYSDYYVENASFLRMDNLSLGYDFGNLLGDAVSLRLDATVQNVFVITKYSGLDPESSYQGLPVTVGIDNNVYPRPRIFSLGINLGF